MDKNDSNSTAEAPGSQEITRREALTKLAKYSAYTAPAVMTLLASRPSMAAITSCPVGTNDGNPPWTDFGDQGEPPPGTPRDPAAGNHPLDVGGKNKQPTVSDANTKKDKKDPKAGDTSTDKDLGNAVNNTAIDCAYIR